jgi:gamma-glutamyl:cysteine ligase YbdK (ATP-grasp superfamily)
MSKPSFLDKVKSVIKETTTHLANGAQNVSKEEYIGRVDVCNTCVHFIHKDYTCGVCGCLMHIKAKWKTSKCPKDKW